MLASDDVSYDLFHAETKGEQALADFVESRLRTGTTDFYHPLKKLNFKTFGDSTKAKTQSSLETTTNQLSRSPSLLDL